MANDDTNQASRLGEYAKTALVVLAVAAGVITIAAFPGLAYVVKEFTRRRPHRKYSSETMRTTLYRMRQRGYVAVVPKGDEVVIQLTPKGKRAAEMMRLENLAIPEPKQWDGRWRFVAFDIPERQRSAREAFREKLKILGFTKPQKSLFVHPYPCEEEIAYLVRLIGIGSHVHFMTVSSFNGERRLCAKYRLPR